MKSIIASVVFVALAASSLSARANLLVNGGFESPDIATKDQIDFFAELSPWWLMSGSVDLMDVNNGVTLGAAYEGQQYLDLNGYNTGEVWHQFDTVPGTTYTLSFAYANNYASASSASMKIRVGDGNGFPLPFTTLTHNTSVANNLNWTPFSATFVATDIGAHLEFVSLTAGTGGILLDAVTLTVPEPATAAAVVLTSALLFRRRAA